MTNNEREAQETASQDSDAEHDRQKIEDAETLIEIVSTLANPRGPLLDESKDPALIRSRIQKAAEAAGLDVSIEADSNDARLTTRGHPDDSHFKKNSHSVTGTAQIGPIHWELDDRTDEIENLGSRFQIYPSTDNEVNLGCSITGRLRGYEMDLSGISKLHPDQAKGLAAALLTATEQARAGGTPSRLPSNAEHRAENLLEPYDVVRGDNGSTRIDISGEVVTHVYEDRGGEIVVDPIGMDLNPSKETSHFTLSIKDARELRGLLDESISAHHVERERYDDQDDG